MLISSLTSSRLVVCTQTFSPQPSHRCLVTTSLPVSLPTSWEKKRSFNMNSHQLSQLLWLYKATYVRSQFKVSSTLRLVNKFQHSYFKISPLKFDSKFQHWTVFKKQVSALTSTRKFQHLSVKKKVSALRYKKVSALNRQVYES